MGQDVRLRNQRTGDDCLSDNSGQPFSPPTTLYDAACCAEDVDHGRDNDYGLGIGYGDEEWKHRDRLRRRTTSQGSSTYGRTCGDFDYIGGIPSELMNGK